MTRSDLWLCCPTWLNVPSQFRRSSYFLNMWGETPLVESILCYSADMSYMKRKMRTTLKCQVGEMDCTTGLGKLIDRPDSVPAEPAGELSYLCFWPIGTAQVAQRTSLLPVNKDITVGICSLLLDHMNYFTTAEAQCLWWTLALQYSLNMAINAQPSTEIRDQIVNYIWQWQLPWLFTNQAKIPRRHYGTKLPLKLKFGQFESKNRKTTSSLLQCFCNFLKPTAAPVTFPFCSKWQCAGGCEKQAEVQVLSKSSLHSPHITSVLEMGGVLLKSEST